MSHRTEDWNDEPMLNEISRMQSTKPLTEEYAAVLAREILKLKSKVEYWEEREHE